jgi:hypothetical protein
MLAGVPIPLPCALMLLVACRSTDSVGQLPDPAGETTWISTDGYPFGTCVVSGRPLPVTEAHVVEVADRRLEVCSAECAEKLRQTPGPYVLKLDRAVTADQLPYYPLDVCPISGRRLDTVGGVVRIVVGDHLVELCCPSCGTAARGRRVEVVARIEAAAYAQQKDDYPLDTCLVSGDKFEEGKVVDFMHGPILVRLGCENCVTAMEVASWRSSPSPGRSAHRPQRRALPEAAERPLNREARRARRIAGVSLHRPAPREAGRAWSGNAQDRAPRPASA